MTEHRFDCRSCQAVFPVENGVPLLLPPDEVVSVPDEVMRALNIPPGLKAEVAAAIAPLTRYRSRLHPEFANFFARFEAREAQVAAVPLSVAETAEAVGRVECLTRSFPASLRSDITEFRSVRIRNGSDRVLYTDQRNPLYLGYKVSTPDGAPVAVGGGRAPFPCSLRPGGELTIAVPVRLPKGLAGRFVITFHFLLADQPAARNASATPVPTVPIRRRLAALRAHLGLGSHRPEPAPVTIDHWFDGSVVAEMTVTAVADPFEFPYVKRGAPPEFDVHEDVARADQFLSEVIRDLRARGLTKVRILEIGAGIHPVSLRTCDADTTVVVSDISLVMQTLAALMHARNPAVLEGRAAFTSFDTMHPPFRDGSFDIICMCAAFHHIAAPDGFLQRVAPMLSAHGRFVALREPCVVDPTDPMYLSELENGFNEQMYELAEWHDIVTRNGLRFDKAVVDYGMSLKFSAVPDRA